MIYSLSLTFSQRKVNVLRANSFIRMCINYKQKLVILRSAYVIFLSFNRKFLAISDELDLKYQYKFYVTKYESYSYPRSLKTNVFYASNAPNGNFLNSDV